MGTDAGQATPVGFDEELFADAWDVHFPAPLSLSLVANTFAHNGMQGELGQLLDLHDSQIEEIVADLQRLVTEPPGARLEVVDEVAAGYLEPRVGWAGRRCSTSTSA